jgi:outer membrane biosynthesis protein TonB
VSALLHAAALFGAFVVWPAMAPPEIMDSDVVPVDLLTVADITNVAPQEEQKAQEAPPEPTPVPVDMAPPPPDLAFAPPPPPPVEEAAADAEKPPEEDKKKPEPPKPEPVKTALAEPNTKPKPEKKKKEEFNLDDIMKGLDEPKETKKTPSKTTEQRQLRAAGAQSALTASEIDALKGKLAKCWNVTAVGAPDPSQLVFVLEFSLNQDGTVAAPPTLDPSYRGQLSDPFFRAAVDAAKRAIHICGPYELPPEKYAGWKEIKIEFDPMKMAGY